MSMNATDTRIYNRAIQDGLSSAVAEMVVCQARLESGNYTSGVFYDDNNAFGMHFAGQSGATASTMHSEYDSDTGEHIPFAHYTSIEAGVDDMVRWLNRRQTEGKFYVADLTGTYDYAYALKSSGYFGISADSYAGTMQGIYTAVFGSYTGGGDPPTVPGDGGSGNNNKLWYIAAALAAAWLISK